MAAAPHRLFVIFDILVNHSTLLTDQLSDCFEKWSKLAATMLHPAPDVIILSRACDESYSIKPTKVGCVDLGGGGMSLELTGDILNPQSKLRRMPKPEVPSRYDLRTKITA
jgi:hypothetical protein